MAHAFKILGTVALALIATASEDEWLSDRDDKLAMMVAKLENGKLCGGVLRVNRSSRVLLFEPAPSEMGCKNKTEASAAEVKSVKTDGPGFQVELQSGKEKKLLLMPLPHAQWLLASPSAKANTLTQQLEGLSGPGSRDGTPMHVGGGSSSAGGKTKAVEVPANVAADTKRAVEAVLSALGR